MDWAGGGNKWGINWGGAHVMDRYWRRRGGGSIRTDSDGRKQGRLSYSRPSDINHSPHPSASLDLDLDLDSISWVCKRPRRNHSRPAIPTSTATIPYRKYIV